MVEILQVSSLRYRFDRILTPSYLFQHRFHGRHGVRLSSISLMEQSLIRLMSGLVVASSS